MKNTILVIFLCTMLFSCKTTSIEDERIDEQEIIDSTPEIPIIDENTSIKDDSTLLDSIDDSIESETSEIFFETEDTLVMDEIINSVEEETGFFTNDDVSPILIDESEVVLIDDFETVLQEDESVELALKDDELPFIENEEIIEKDIQFEEKDSLTTVITPVELEEDQSIDDSLISDELEELDVTLPLITTALPTVDSDQFVNTGLPDTLPLVPLTEAIEIDSSLPEDTLPNTEVISPETDSSEITVLDTLIDGVTVESQTENNESTNQSFPIDNSTIVTETIDQEMDTIVVPAIQDEGNILRVPTSEIEVDSSINSETVIVPAPAQVADSTQGDDIVPPILEDTQGTIIVDSNGSILDIIPSADVTIPSQMNSQESSTSEKVDTALETSVLPPVEEFVAPIEVSQKLELFEDDYIDVYLPGHGWIYLGEVEESDPTILDFYARYIDGDDTLFNFYAENPGTTILHFYKQDILANIYLDEYIEVTVKPIKIVVETPKRSDSRTEEMYGISSEPEVSLIGGRSETIEFDNSEYEFVPEDILDQAQEAYDEERFEDSIALLDEYTSLGVDEIDRALFLYGKNYESNSDVKNVRLSAASYEKIVDSFPDSVYWDEATKRLIYLERFYINIR